MAKNKTFVHDNPVLQFITAQEEPAAADSPIAKIEMHAPAGPETKSRRINLLVTPSAADGLRKVATMRRTSANSIINELLDAYLAQHTEEIEKYNATFEEE